MISSDLRWSVLTLVTQTRIYTHTYIHIYACTHMYTHIHMHIHTHTHTLIETVFGLVLMSGHLLLWEIGKLPQEWSWLYPGKHQRQERGLLKGTPEGPPETL